MHPTTVVLKLGGGPPWGDIVTLQLGMDDQGNDL